MAAPKIKPIQVGEKTRYRFVVDIGDDPVTGKRRQLTRTYDRRKEAEKELAKILTEVNRGIFTAPSKTTVDEYLTDWLRSATRDREEATARNYEDALRPVRERLGALPLQKLTTRHVEDLVDWMLAEGRRRGGKPGTGLGARSVQLTLSRLRSALADAVRRRLVEFNVAEPVKPPRQTKKQREPWTPEEVRAFFTSLKGERLHAPLLLSAMGLRPAEVCGAPWLEVRWRSFAEPCQQHNRRWCTETTTVIDEATGEPKEAPTCYGVGATYRIPTLTVIRTRTLVATDAGMKVVEKGPKSAAGWRALPMPMQVAAALKAFSSMQAAEKLAAGPAYKDTGYVLVDELGRPQRTDWLRRRAYKAMAAAGVRKVRLYDARHACLTWMRMQGVPGPIVSAWAGHSDLGLADRVYVHPSEKDLEQGGAALSVLLG